MHRSADPPIRRSAGRSSPGRSSSPGDRSLRTIPAGVRAPPDPRTTPASVSRALPETAHHSTPRPVLTPRTGVRARPARGHPGALTHSPHFVRTEAARTLRSVLTRARHAPCAPGPHARPRACLRSPVRCPLWPVRALGLPDEGLGSGATPAWPVRREGVPGAVGAVPDCEYTPVRPHRFPPQDRTATRVGPSARLTRGRPALPSAQPPPAGVPAPPRDLSGTGRLLSPAAQPSRSGWRPVRAAGDAGHVRHGAVRRGGRSPPRGGRGGASALLRS
ncbi:hypothetical protein SDIAM103S_04114 [Streptomyces diastaticus subsp. diastaticus]